jgi:hypothetical protein
MKHSNKTASASNQPRRVPAEQPVASIREIEQVRAQLQDQLHRLYWWVFNACRIKGFLRAKQLDDLDAESELPIDEQSMLPSAPAGSAEHPAPELK